MQNNRHDSTRGALPARRTFFRNLGKLSLGAAGITMAGLPKLAGQTSAQDSANQIFATALVAEDMLTTFYYNGLIGAVIENPNLAGPGGTAVLPSNPSNVQNIDSLRTAFAQEIAHANLLRSLANAGSGAATDPNQTFYFPSNAFATLDTFCVFLESLEAALIGLYLVAIREFATMAASTPPSIPDGPAGGPYSAAQLQYYAQVVASIMGVEAEHRVLGGVIPGQLQPNNLAYEQSDSLLSVATGSGSAMSALAPFLNPATGPAYSLAVARAAATTLGIASAGSPPSYTPVASTIPVTADTPFLTATPNPIPVKAGQDGVTTIAWNAPAASVIQVRVNSPSGPLFTNNLNNGLMATGAWVTSGTTFYLQDASSGTPTLASNTLATVMVTLTGS